MIVQRIPQSTGAAASFLLSMLSQIAPSPASGFGAANFLFVNEPPLGSPGFKRFRPIVRENSTYAGARTMRRISRIRNMEIFRWSNTQFGSEDSYDRMDEVMSPEPLDPMRAMMEAITALDEQVKTRATAVENGRKFQNGGRGDASMPDESGDLRDNRRVGGFLDAGARFPPADRDRCGARISPIALRSAASATRYRMTKVRRT